MKKDDDEERAFRHFNDRQLFRAMRHAKGDYLERLRREAARRGLQEEVSGV